MDQRLLLILEKNMIFPWLDSPKYLAYTTVCGAGSLAGIQRNQ